MSPLMFYSYLRILSVRQPPLSSLVSLNLLGTLSVSPVGYLPQTTDYSGLTLPTSPISFTGVLV